MKKWTSTLDAQPRNSFLSTRRMENGKTGLYTNKQISDGPVKLPNQISLNESRAQVAKSVHKYSSAHQSVRVGRDV